MEECIRVNGLCKKYGKTEIVKSINFSVEQGKIFAFLGPNGAGKSTTMNMIATLLEKTKGTIMIDGIDVDENRYDVKSKIGIVFQEDVLDGDLTVYKNLWYRGGLYLKTNKQLKERIRIITKLLSLEKLLNQKYKECSGGQKRLVQLGRAMIPNPKLLIMDEPTTGLDPITRQNVWNVLIHLKQTLNITIFFTTHYLDEASKADTICILKNGCILVCDTLKEIQKKWSVGMKEGSLDDIYFRLLMEAERSSKNI